MSDELQKELAGVRAEIDGIDGELLRLLSQRARCAQKVGEIKAAHGEAGPTCSCVRETPRGGRWRR